MAQNPIYIGFAWHQAFDFPVGFLETGDAVRAEIRRAKNPPNALDGEPVAVVETGGGIFIEGDRVFVSLSQDQTTGLTVDRVVTNFVVVRGGTEIPIGKIITIPVVRLPTRPLA